MKKLLTFLFLLISIPVFAANYTFILEDGTTIECDSYRKEGGRYYYEGMYGFEAFVSTEYVVEIVDNLKEASIDNFVEKLREGDEDAIKELFEYAAMEYLRRVDGKEGETGMHYRVTYSKTYSTKLAIDMESIKYSVDRTDSLLFPYEATISCYCTIYLYHYGTNSLQNTFTHPEGTVTLMFRYDDDTLKWEYYDSNGESFTDTYIAEDIDIFDTIQDELITRGSQ